MAMTNKAKFNIITVVLFMGLMLGAFFLFRYISGALALAENVESLCEKLALEIEYYTASHQYHQDLLISRGYEIEGDLVNVLETGDGRTVYSPHDFEGVTVLFFDCDADLNCENTSFDPAVNLDEQIPVGEDGIKRVVRYIIGRDGQTTAAFRLPVETPREAVMHDVFEASGEEVKGTQRAKEINNGYQDIYLQAIEGLEGCPITDTWQKSVRYALGGTAVHDCTDIIYQVTELGLTLGRLRRSERYIKDEYAWIQENMEKGTAFYDGTTTLDAHMQSVRQNVETLYALFKDMEAVHEPLFDSQVWTIDPQLTDKLLYLRANYTRDYIDLQFAKRDTEESELSKALRLRELEVMLANQLADACDDGECREELIQMVMHPSLCRMSTQESCIIEHFKGMTPFCSTEHLWYEEFIDGC